MASGSCFLPSFSPPAGMGVIDALNSTTHNSQLADGTPSVCDTTTCHGYCIDLIECTTGEILTEKAYIRTMADWQNAVFFLFIVGIMAFGRVLFRRMYQIQLAAHKAITTEAPTESVAGSSDELEGTTHAVQILTAAVNEEPRPLMGGSSSGRSGGRQRMPTRGVKFKQYLSQLKPKMWWHQAAKEPAVLICLAAFYYSISNVCFAAITEFEAPERVYDHVGWDTQTTQAGVEARMQNIGWGVAWMAMGVVYMLVAQVVVRWLMFRGMDESIVHLVTEGALGDDADTAGSNIAAAIVGAWHSPPPPPLPSPVKCGSRSGGTGTHRCPERSAARGVRACVRAEAGSVVASGLVASGSVAGAPSQSPGADFAVATLYFVLSQVRATPRSQLRGGGAG
jgi:hypothetical protein